MHQPTRRNFLQSAAAALASTSPLLRATRAMASPFGLPVGLQLYSVREMLPKDYEGTLKQIAALTNLRELYLNHTAIGNAGES